MRPSGTLTKINNNIKVARKEIGLEYVD